MAAAAEEEPEDAAADRGVCWPAGQNVTNWKTLELSLKAPHMIMKSLPSPRPRRRRPWSES